ncbi:MAG: hypothetical protein ACFFFB_13045 [Candidatus Heimdallarchaeota archaeon]
MKNTAEAIIKIIDDMVKHFTRIFNAYNNKNILDTTIRGIIIIAIISKIRTKVGVSGKSDAGNIIMFTINRITE